MFKKGWIYLSVFFLFFVLTCFHTRPLIANFRSAVYGYTNDSFPYMHDFWAYKEILSSKITGSELINNLEYSKIINQPFLEIGATLLTLLFGSEVFAFNTIIFLSFILAGFFSWFCFYKITKNYFISFILAYGFSFSPDHLTHSKFQLEMSATWIFPVLWLFANKLLTNNNLKNFMMFGILLGFSFWFSNYYGYFSAIAFGIYLLVFVKNKSLQDFFKKAFAIFTPAFFLVLLGNITYILLLLRGINPDSVSWKSTLRNSQDYISYSARPWHYLLPDIENPIFGKFTKEVLIKISTIPPYFLTTTYFGNEHTIFLGYSVIALFLITVIGFNLKKLQDRFTVNKLLLTIFLLCLISAPPFITVNLHKFYFPSFILSKIFPMFRAYSRIAIAVLFLTLIVNAYFFKNLLNTRGRRKYLLIAIPFLLFMTVEFYKPPHLYKLYPAPSEYTAIKSLAKNNDAVFEFSPPVDRRNLFYQSYFKLPTYSINSLSEMNQTKVAGSKFLIYRYDNYKITKEVKDSEEMLDLWEDPGEVDFIQSNGTEVIDFSKKLNEICKNKIIDTSNYAVTYQIFPQN